MSSEPSSASSTNTGTTPNPYIRTYARDVARLSGKNTVDAAPKAAPKKSPPPAQEESLIVHNPADAVTPELSDLEKQAETRDLRESSTEQELSDELADMDTPLAEPVNLPKVTVGANTPEPVPEKTRESLLERLREHAKSRPAPVADAPTPQTFQPILPQKIEAAPEPVQPPVPPPPPPAPEPVPVPVPPIPPVPPKEESPAPASAPAPFHSFATDFADHIDEKKASAFSVLAAEKDAHPAARPAPTRHSSVLPLAAGVVLIIASGLGVFAAYHYMRQNAPVPVTPPVVGLITPDKTIELSGTSLANALAQAANQLLAVDNVAIAYIASSPATPQGSAQTAAQGGSLISATAIGAPDILLRNINSSSTAGIVHAGDETRPFFLLSVSSYDRTFVGMLDWENTMPQDLALYYPPYPITTQASSTSATSTSAAISSPQFTDEIVASHSVRVLRDAQGRSLMLYGYTADKQTLIIARDEAAFSLLLNRL